MSSEENTAIIGGGFYGAAIAIYLAKQRHFKNITLLEREPALLARASYSNQARVHNGYHYPRSFTTAYRSRINLPRFVRDWPDAIKKDFTKVYAIARHNSKVTSQQFERFCHEIGAKIQFASPAIRGLFEPRLIESVFLVEEYAFDALKLADSARKELAECGVKVRLGTHATAISIEQDGLLQLAVEGPVNGSEILSCKRVFNCTYSGLNQIQGDFRGTRTQLKHEITELALVQAPPALAGMGITVMDGPFFSLMPFPAKGIHTLSHVRYTPHLHWIDEKGLDPTQKLKQYGRATRVERMIRDAGRYLPAILDVEYINSLFEVKTVLIKNETDDGRPILFEKHEELPGLYSVLGGKIDNIYDVLEKLDADALLD